MFCEVYDTDSLVPIDTYRICDFPGGWSPDPATSSGSARGIVNWVRRHIFLAKRLNMTLTPLMQVLCGCGKQRQGPTV